VSLLEAKKSYSCFGWPCKQAATRSLLLYDKRWSGMHHLAAVDVHNPLGWYGGATALATVPS